MNALVRRGLLLGAMLVVAGSFHGLLQGIGWLFVVGAALLLVASVGAVVGALVRRAGWAVAAQIAALVLVVTLFFASGPALFGIIPTFGSVDALVVLGQHGVESIRAQGTPAEATPGIVFLLAAGLGAVAIVVDLIGVALAVPALTGIPLLVVAAVPSLIQPSLDDPVLFALLAAAYLAVLVTRRGRRTRAVAVAVGASAVVAALVLALVLPPVAPDTPPIGAQTGLSANPIVDLGADLRRPDPTTAFTYTTDADRPLYFTLTVLDDLDGQQWAIDDGADLDGDLSRIGPVPGRPADAAVSSVRTSVRMGAIRDIWAPSPWAPWSVQGLTGTWGFDPDTLGVRGTGSSISGQKYVVKSDIARPTRESLEAAPAAGSGFDEQLALPDGLPAVVADTAREVTADADTRFDKALALQSWFRGGTFRYSIDAPSSGGYDGSQANYVAAFLAQKAGYCVHFASAMAIMARTLGIPARIAVGFLPGTVSGTSGGTDTYTVSTDDMHAWPELYFAGVGWVRFEPTPGRGVLPSFPIASTPGSTSAPTSTPTSSSTASPRPTASRPTDGTPEERANADAAAAALRTLGRVLAVLGIVLAAILVLLVPWGVRRVRRGRRLAHPDDPLGAWRELGDSAFDLGVDRVAGETPRAFGERIAPSLDAAAVEALVRVRGAVERAAYAESGAAVEPADVRGVIAGLRASATRARRLRASFAPRSLVRDRPAE
ncbi:DUF3488 and transglutaminase-like domain-containing protein [Galbitalea sp. SE-J8]|uniref:transglutaminase family protein n=1 Tax=Galbitalea sp. SE-J8 TaxID=3054952 RepID=UPI00259D09AE|nr:DUF3488 and transglutaminase-like domain-containing protein [Galbitalea sp. SE-J8]MDM4762941.1 DUF3488 and transglutaminase-like domain-containing protein [Galbitalea sp. SE-J8]